MSECYYNFESFLLQEINQLIIYPWHNGSDRIVQAFKVIFNWSLLSLISFTFREDVIFTISLFNQFHGNKIASIFKTFIASHYLIIAKESDNSKEVEQALSWKRKNLAHVGFARLPKALTNSLRSPIPPTETNNPLKEQIFRFNPTRFPFPFTVSYRNDRRRTRHRGQLVRDVVAAVLLLHFG